MVASAIKREDGQVRREDDRCSAGSSQWFVRPAQYVKPNFVRRDNTGLYTLCSSGCWYGDSLRFWPGASTQLCVRVSSYSRPAFYSVRSIPCVVYSFILAREQSIILSPHYSCAPHDSLTHHYSLVLVSTWPNFRQVFPTAILLRSFASFDPKISARGFLEGVPNQFRFIFLLFAYIQFWNGLLLLDFAFYFSNRPAAEIRWITAECCRGVLTRSALFRLFYRLNWVERVPLLGQWINIDRVYVGSTCLNPFSHWWKHLKLRHPTVQTVSKVLVYLHLKRGQFCGHNRT